MSQTAFLSVASVLFLVTVGVNSYATSNAHNNAAREKHRLENEYKLNEIDSADSHWEEPWREHEEGTKYAPDWASLDARPLPSWYDQSKIGIFIHWGVFSVPGVESEWFWKQMMNGDNDTKGYMDKNYRPGETYQELAPQFTAEFYDPVAWAELFKKAGARYIVLTSKHHEGFTLWPSKYSFSWNAMDVGAHRDLLGDLATAIRANTTIKFGLYHSLFEWFNPLWMNDYANNFTTDVFARTKAFPELYELVDTYKPEVVWSDGEWEAPETYWKSREFLAWLYNDSPVKDTVVTNDRWAEGTLCKHGGFYTCVDRYNPGVLLPHKWENCFTVDRHSWGYRRNAIIADYLSPEEIMTTIVGSVACNGNVLLNVGPTREGMIPPIQQERLLQMGEWLDINGEAIYNSIPYIAQNDTVTPGVWYTTNTNKTKVYGMITSWPESGSVTLGALKIKAGTPARMFGYDSLINWSHTAKGVFIQLPHRDVIKSKWVWTLVFG